jgi:ubiquinone/menaquinone biosynthesis C-methylase UbiE
VSTPSRSDRYLSCGQASRVYDRIGRLQDVQARVERPALDELVAHANFEHAQAVFELGYGTGALAKRLFEQHLSAQARYVGVDVSRHMHELASRRLRRFADRAELRVSDGGLRFPFADGVFDRFVSSYVLDLLAPTDIDLVVGEARRLLAPGGLLCLTSLTTGTTATTRTVARIWQALWRIRPELLGGCRPIRIAEHLNPAAWAVRHHADVARLGFSFEVVVAASRLP